MAHLLLVAHEPLASALKAVAAHTFAELAERVAAVDVPPSWSGEVLEVELRQRIGRLTGNGDDEVLILTDVFGATPANVAQRLTDGVRVRAVAGVNVPMLWRALNYAALPLDDLVARALAGATQGVMAVASTRPQNQALPTVSHDPLHHHHQQ